MKIVVFGPEKRVGALVGDRVVDLGSAGLPGDLGAFIEGGPAAIDRAKGVLAEVDAGGSAATVHALADVTLRAPHVPGARIACAGGNFADHTLAMAQKTAHDPVLAKMSISEVAGAMRKRGIWGFWKIGREAVDPDGAVIYPAYSRRLDYEAEVAIVVGRQVKDGAAADLPGYIWGVTLFADWSVRDGNEAPAPLRFATVKNFDTSYSIGPCIVVDEGLDPSNVDVELTLNGELRQQYNTRDMVVKFGEYFAYLTRDFTFYPGDMISGGTAAGTAADSSEYTDGIPAPDRFLAPGDKVEIRSPAIGALRASIVAKSA